MAKPYPIICLLGDRGAGKTVFSVYLIEQALKEGANVYTNIKTTFKNKKLHDIDFEEIRKNPESIENGYLIMDEMHVGSDAFAFLSKQNKELSVFATQIRKRKITWIYITQRFNRIDKRLRDQTDYIYKIEGKYVLVQGKNKNFNSIYDNSTITIFDIVDSGQYKKVRSFNFYGKNYFKFYNTNQLILDT